MAQLGNFNPDAVPEGERDFPLLLDGNYVAHITDSDLLTTKSGNGQMLKLTVEILEGACRGRKVWDNLNILNPNAQAQEIAQRSLKHICTAVGHVGVLTDSEALHFKPMRVRVGHKEAQGEYAAQNVIKSYEPMSGARPAAPAAPASAFTPPGQATEPTAAAAAGGGNRPWK